MTDAVSKGKRCEMINSIGSLGTNFWKYFHETISLIESLS